MCVIVDRITVDIECFVSVNVDRIQFLKLKISILPPTFPPLGGCTTCSVLDTRFFISILVCPKEGNDSCTDCSCVCEGSDQPHDLLIRASDY